ncbi:unnamed protein product [Dracunculus medinensis]|uniref:Endo/exonuclease/phosphatase domain-containing protein n=1 Tax=Dracunculus medinensis TaxID=318479 RepID=A0A0N4UHJ6_DRAME|nr:unnamed protein product [Dracunculus medinensis]
MEDAICGFCDSSLHDTTNASTELVRNTLISLHSSERYSLQKYIDLIALYRSLINEELKNDINNLKASSLGNFEHSKIETEQVLETIEEYFEKKEKKPCLVGINIPEKSTDDESADRLLAENIVLPLGSRLDSLRRLLLIDNPNSIFCINETWLDDSIDNREVSRKDRTINSSNIRGSGLIMLIPDYYKLITFDDYVCCSFESLIIKIYLNNRNISLLNLYRSPGYGSKFTRDLYNMLLKLKLIGTDYVIVGDLNMPNIDWENSCLKSSNKFEENFLNFCTYVGLEQHVKVATRYNTILDVMLATPTSLIDSIRVLEPFCNSDHNIIHASLKLDRYSPPSRFSRSYRH